MEKTGTLQHSPLMERYLKLKTDYPNALLFFRMGDFYELFFEDAKQAAKLLGLTLTSRSGSTKGPVPMAGIPYHQLHRHFATLKAMDVAAVACESEINPETGLVIRAVAET